MARWGMVVDLDACSGCGACVTSCCAENNLMPGTPADGERGRVIRWMQLLPQVEGTYPEVRVELTPMMCQQCDRPSCVPVCPVSATYKNPEGLVAQVYWRCIGCRYCVNACPYTCKFFNWGSPGFTPGQAACGNPDVSIRQQGVTEKCSFCHHRLQRAREAAAAKGREVKAGEYLPACAEACPSQAIVFGDLDDPGSDVAKLTRGNRAYRILEDELATHPKVSYLKRRV